MTNSSICIHFGYSIHEYREANRQILDVHIEAQVTWGLNEIGTDVITGGKNGVEGSKERRTLL